MLPMYCMCETAEMPSMHTETQQVQVSATIQHPAACLVRRVLELSNTLNAQYNIAAELRRNLEAEAALHTSNVRTPAHAMPFAVPAFMV